VLFIPTVIDEDGSFRGRLKSINIKITHLHRVDRVVHSENSQRRISSPILMKKCRFRIAGRKLIFTASVKRRFIKYTLIYHRRIRSRSLTADCFLQDRDRSSIFIVSVQLPS